MTETMREGAAAAAGDLVARGHRVLLCHPDGAATCVAMAGGRCPLERGGVDAAVVVHDGSSVAASLGRGAQCAGRRGIPLVVGGDPANDPYAEWASVEEEGSRVGRAVETVVALPLPMLTNLATRALHAGLEADGLAGRVGRVEVRRRDGGLVAELVGLDAGVTSGQLAMAAVRVAAAIRSVDAWARRIDVTVGAGLPLLSTT